MGKYHVIYVPGLGDSRTYGQNLLIQLWRLFGVTPHYFPLYWATKEPFQTKIDRLIAEISRLRANGYSVALCGASAGASATLRAFALYNEVDSLVWICGKINNPQTVRPRIYEINSAFKESMDLVPTSLASLDSARKHRILSIHSLNDTTVPINDTKVPGTVEKTIPSRGHSLSIFFAIVFSGRAICRFIRLWQHFGWEVKARSVTIF